MDRNSDRQPITISLSRSAGGPLVIYPASLTITPASFGIPSETLTAGVLRLTPPPGWRVRSVAENTWTATLTTPLNEIDPDQPVVFQLVTTDVNRCRHLYRTVPVTLDLHSRFDPLCHPFPYRNSAKEIGEISPGREFLPATYSLPVGILRSVLFNGLYSDIVYLTESGPSRGGLCSGMARWSIARSIAGKTDPAPFGQALEQITVLHGRQLTDRALFAGLPWFLRGSSRSAYRAIRRDLLEKGITNRALDIGVPKLWRKDLLQALVRQGHTVVPYRLQQHSPSLATLEVYDPNRPPDHPSSPQKIDFQLDRNRYQLRNLVRFEDGGVGMVAVRQRHYERRGTAILATIASGAMLAGKRIHNLWKQRSG